MKKQFVWALAAMLAVVMAACISQKGPAEQAVAGAEAALAAERDTAQKYAPDQLQAVETQVQGMKEALAKGDYKSVLAAAPAVNTAMSTLKDAVQTKQQEAAAAMEKAKDAWGATSAEVPKMVDAIQTRVNALSKGHHLPKGVTKDAVDEAKSALDSLKSMWSEATNAASSGDYTTAMSKAQTVKDRAAEIMKSLGMSAA